MDVRILVGTAGGLWQVRDDVAQPVETLAGRSVTALARDAKQTWALVDSRTLWAQRDEDWYELAAIEGPPATCLALTPVGLLVGTEQAHLLMLTAGRLERVESFEHVDGRETWYTPWGDPADVRSIAVAADGAVHVNVHVGGVVRSRDRGRSWTPTVDIESDVHQVLAHPAPGEVVLAAAAIGLGVSRDSGDSWAFVTAGLHARYLRAVAVSGNTVLVSASTGHHGRRSAIYRKPLDVDADFTRCREGLPTWFDDNIDTACLAAAGAVVVFGTSDGRVFRSLDAGERWQLLAKGLPAVASVTLA